MWKYMIEEPLAGASHASVTLADVVAVIRRFVGADGDGDGDGEGVGVGVGVGVGLGFGAAPASGAIMATASRAGIALRATRRTDISCSLRDARRPARRRFEGLIRGAAAEVRAGVRIAPPATTSGRVGRDSRFSAKEQSLRAGSSVRSLSGRTMNRSATGGSRCSAQQRSLRTGRALARRAMDESEKPLAR
jgi:hypothetical protein